MTVAVLGAGLLGTCTALELSKRGIQVDLYDREGACVTQAGLRNEGKLHLGFVYGADPSFNTAEKMILGALSFYPLLRRWIGDGIETLPISSPFIYLLDKESLLSEEIVEDYFFSLERKILTVSSPEYPGGALEKVRKLSDFEWEKMFSSEKIKGAYQTPERSIDPHHLALLLRSQVARSKGISFYPRSEITDVSISQNQTEINYLHEGAHKQKSYDVVVNALWDGRLLLDQQAGLFDEPPWSYRIKHAIFLKSHERIDTPSATIIQGAYGDVVYFGEGNYYFSWYPICQQGFAKNQIAPPDWNRNLSREEGEEMAAEALKRLAEYIPALERIRSGRRIELSVLGGVIYAQGDTDVSDPKSALHRRDQPAIRSRGTYYSINPGKFTLCPYFANQAADQICSASFASRSIG